MFKQFLIVIIGIALIEAKPHHQFRNLPRIIGGSPASQGQFPYSASLQTANSSLHFCGATIINQCLLLTSASCLQQDPEQILVYTGSAYLDNNGTYHKVREIYIPPYYNSSTLKSDIGIVKVTRPIRFGTFTQPIELPIRNLTHLGDYAAVVGWGSTSYPDEDLPNQLQYLTSSIVDIKQCQEAFDADIDPDTQICFGGNKGQGWCFRDSGNPLVFETNNTNYIIGISSYGSCGEGDPDVYTGVRYQMPWISLVIAQQAGHHNCN